MILFFAVHERLAQGKTSSSEELVPGVPILHGDRQLNKGALAEPRGRALSVQAQYVKLAYGIGSWPSGTEILTLDVCEEAIQALGIDNLGSIWEGDWNGIPAGCSVREAGVLSPGGGQNNPRGHWNSAGRGSGRSDLAPICYTQALVTLTVSTPDGFSNPNNKVIAGNYAVQSSLHNSKPFWRSASGMELRWSNMRTQWIFDDNEDDTESVAWKSYDSTNLHPGFGKYTNDWQFGSASGNMGARVPSLTIAKASSWSVSYSGQYCSNHHFLVTELGMTSQRCGVLAAGQSMCNPNIVFIGSGGAHCYCATDDCTSRDHAAGYYIWSQDQADRTTEQTTNFTTSAADATAAELSLNTTNLSTSTTTMVTIISTSSTGSSTLQTSITTSSATTRTTTLQLESLGSSSPQMGQASLIIGASIGCGLLISGAVGASAALRFADRRRAVGPSKDGEEPSVHDLEAQI